MEERETKEEEPIVDLDKIAKTKTALEIITLILLIAFLVSSFYGNRLEVKYNKLVEKYNKCSKDLFGFVNPSTNKLVDLSKVDWDSIRIPNSSEG